MNSFNYVFLALVLAIAAPSIISAFSLPTLRPIGGDLYSTSRIVAKMCQGVNATTAQAFWDCYNEAPGIEIFKACQMKVSGYLLDTPENFQKTCKSLYTFPLYAACLKMRFDEAGIDMDATLDTVNKCEARVLGIE
jgi:hypothetical protein